MGGKKNEIKPSLLHCVCEIIIEKHTLLLSCDLKQVSHRLLYAHVS